MATTHAHKFLLSSRRDLNGQQVLLAWPQTAVVKVLSSRLPPQLVEAHIMSRCAYTVLWFDLEAFTAVRLPPS